MTDLRVPTQPTVSDRRTGRTTVPWRGPTDQSPRRIKSVRASDVLALLGSLAAAFATTTILWAQLSLFTGAFGYVVVTWCLFVVYYAVLVSFDENRPTMRDRVASVTVHSLGGLVLVVLGFVIVYTVVDGLPALRHTNFYTTDMGRTGPLDPLTQGGMLHAMVGTLIEVGITLVLAVPLGLLGGVFLHEVPGRFSRFVRIIVEAMTALPDIIAGLFIYATLILILGLKFCGFAAACALAVTVLPIIIRASDVVLRLVPGSLKEAAYALGSGQWRTVWHVLLPTARSGLMTAVILGTARAVGETSPVLITAGLTGHMNFSPLKDPMMSLPLMAYTSVQSPLPNMVARGFGAAATLVVLVVALFLTARLIAGRQPGDLSWFQQRRRAATSRRDARRFTRLYVPRDQTTAPIHTTYGASR
jgi:phosphate transport system permease protein